MADSINPDKLTGKLKWLDSQCFGYILPDSLDFPELYVTPFSLSSKYIIKEGDSVEFNVKLGGPEVHHAFQAIDVVPTKVYCIYCKRIGHKLLDCQNFRNYKCSRCGIVGHFSKNCDQKYKGWFFDKNNKRKTVRRGSYGGSWLSLFGGAYNSGGVGPGSTAAKKIVCVKKREDVKKVEEVEDCFILEFDPTIDDDHDDDDQSVKSIVCVKKREDVKKVEKVEDCFILEFDPSELDKFSELSLCEKSNVVGGGGDDDDVTILAEKGKVACRDYPHPRYLCAKHPFKKTSHVLHCKMCYCYICDIPAPCKKWNEGFKIYGLNHCDATDELSWRVRRDLEKSQTQGR